MATDVPSRPYVHLGDEFRVGSARWWGDVVMGADAIYLLQGRPARGRGLVAPFELVADRVLPRWTLSAGTYAQIPESVRGDERWPVRQRDYAGVLVVPREEVAFLYHQAGKLETRFVFNGVEIAIPHGRFGGKAVREFAEAANWPMFWDGTPVNLPGRTGRELSQGMSEMPFGRPIVSYSAITVGFVLGALPMWLAAMPSMNQDLVNVVWLAGWVLGVSLILFGWVALRRGA